MLGKLRSYLVFGNNGRVRFNYVVLKLDVVAGGGSTSKAHRGASSGRVRANTAARLNLTADNVEATAAGSDP